MGLIFLGKGLYDEYGKIQDAKQTEKLSQSVEAILNNKDKPDSNSDGEEKNTNTNSDMSDEGISDEDNIEISSNEDLAANPIDDSGETNPNKEQEKEISSKIIKASEEEYSSDNIDGFIEVGEGLIREPIIIDPDQEYVRKLPNGEDSFAGTIIAYGEQMDLDKSYAVLYGHGMKNKTRFGYLLDYDTMMDKLTNGRLFTEKSGVRYLELVQFSMIGIEDFEKERLTSYSELVHYMDIVDDVGWVFYESERELGEDDFVITLSTCATEDASTRINAIYREIKF